MSAMLLVGVGVAWSCTAISLSSGHPQLIYEGAMLGLVVGLITEIFVRVLRSRSLSIQETSTLVLGGVSLVIMQTSKAFAQRSKNTEFSCRMQMLSIAALCGTCFSAAAYMHVSRERR